MKKWKKIKSNKKISTKHILIERWIIKHALLISGKSKERRKMSNGSIQLGEGERHE